MSAITHNLDHIIASSSSSHPLQSRKSAIESKIKTVATRLGLSQHVGIKWVGFSDTPTAMLFKNTVHLPPWFLLKYEDIPSQFRITSIDDPRLNDQNFLNEMAKWMNGKIKEFGLSSTCDSTE